MTEELKSGVELLFAGMGIVFMFLVMLVVAINIMSAFIQRYFPEATSGTPRIAGGLDKATVAAITAAVHRYRNQQH